MQPKPFQIKTLLLWVGGVIAVLAGAFLCVYMLMSVCIESRAVAANVRLSPAPATAFSMEKEENDAKPPERENEVVFTMEAVKEDTDDKDKAVQRSYRVLIYHTHTYEAYEKQKNQKYTETERWRTANAEYNVVRVGEELAALLRAAGIETVHDQAAYEPPKLASAYARSLKGLEERVIDKKEEYDLIIDLHRDAYSAGNGANTVSVGDIKMARLMFLIGKGTGQTGAGFDQRPDWNYNYSVANLLKEALNAQVNDLCRETKVKSGRYNQHIAQGCVLIEVGNNKNTLEEALCAMPYLAHAICEYFDTLGLQ